MLATIVNTVGPEKLGSKLDAVTARNIRAAAQQEKNHYELLTSSAVGGKAATKTIYVPDEVFASKESLLTTLVVGDQVFINAYLLGTTVFARQGTLSGSKFARYAAEIMATEAVHRALALQSLGMLGNDRVYAKFAQREEVAGCRRPAPAASTTSSTPSPCWSRPASGSASPAPSPARPTTTTRSRRARPFDPGVNTIAIS